MFRKLELDVEYFEEIKKIVLHTDSIDDDEHNVWGDVYINHEDKEIRIYNFSGKLNIKQKMELIYVILENSILFPHDLFSKENNYGDISQYILLINGYLLDGSFRERGKHHKSIIEEFVETDYIIGENSEVSKLREKVRHFYEKHKYELGQTAVNIYMTNDNMLKGISDYNNFSRLFSAYLWSKGKRFRVITSGKFWKKERRLEYLPY